MIIDFRIRPPAKSFLKLSIFNKDFLKKSHVQAGVKPPESFLKDSMGLLIQEMKEAGVVRGVIMGRQAAAMYGSVPNDEIAEIVKEHPGSFIPFAGIDPMNIKAAVAEVERAVKKLGFKGIQLDPGWAETPMMADDRRLYPVYAKCDDLGVPVALVISIYVGPDVTYSFPAAIQRVARDFPSLKVLVVHGAWPWVHEMVGVCFTTDNIWLVPDIYLHIPGMPGATHFVEAANYYLGDRLLFASSYPLRPIKDSIEEFSRLPFKDEVKEKALYSNAARLLGL